MLRRSFMLGALASAGIGRHADAASLDLSGRRRHLIMRHALAPGFSDPPYFDVEDCSTQRNLDDRGRAQARRTGKSLRRAGVSVDRVLSSRWCRCLDTARLLDMGPVFELDSLNSFFETRERREAQTAALREFLLGLEPSFSCLLVTHQVNIVAFLGRGAASGEVFVFSLDEDGAPTVLESLVEPA